jgi:hypothetical protein
VHESIREDDQRRELFYVSSNGLNRVLSVEISPALYWFATTDGEDKHWRGLFCRKLGSWAECGTSSRPCGDRAIAGGELRLSKIRAYAEKLGLRVDLHPGRRDRRKYRRDDPVADPPRNRPAAHRICLLRTRRG